MNTFDADSYATAWRNRNSEERKRIRKRTRAAFSEATLLAGRMATDAGVEKVVLFGSVAEDTARDENFDIDLAIYGGSWSRAQEIAEDSPFKVDVIEYDAVPAHVRERIDEKGMVLWPAE